MVLGVIVPYPYTRRNLGILPHRDRQHTFQSTACNLRAAEVHLLQKEQMLVATPPKYPPQVGLLASQQIIWAAGVKPVAAT